MPAIDDGPPVYELSEEEKKCWSALRRVLGTTACRGWTPVAEVLPGLFLSGCELAGDGERLKTLGITHVLNCAPLEVPTGAVFYEPLGISYCELPAFVDSEATDFLHYWDTARDFIQSARQEKQQDGTRQCRQLIHCRAGVNRSGVIAVAYVMLESQVSVLEAVRRVKSKRQCVLTNETFQQGLVKLAAALGCMDDTLPPVQHLDSLAEDDEEDDEEGGAGRSGQAEEEEDSDSEEEDDDDDDYGLEDEQRRQEREAAGAEEEEHQRGEGQSKVQLDAGLTVQSRQCS